MAKVRGRERPAVSVYAKNSGTYETAAAEAEKDTIRNRPAVHPLSRNESYQEKKSTESNPGGRIDAKDQRPET